MPAHLRGQPIQVWLEGDLMVMAQDSVKMGDSNMAKVLVVTSGKGGVGKTTSTAALGAALASAGKNVVLIDFDVGLRNLDLVMGAERRVVYDLINVVQGDAKLAQALIRDKRVPTLSAASRLADARQGCFVGRRRFACHCRIEGEIRLGDLR